MKRQPPTAVAVFVALLCLLWLAGVVSADSDAPPTAPAEPQAGAPGVVGYQGQVTVGGVAYTGTGYFKFAVVDQAGTTSYWSNDGTSTGGGQPANAVTLAVSGGLFNVLLGDTTLANMTALPASAFSNTSSFLRTWFSSDGTTFTLLSPDRRIAAAPYALQAQEAANADTLDGQHGSYYQSASNLNAGTLDNARFSAHGDLAAESYLGNANGDLAQNNGQLQVGLNADALDGQHGSYFQNAGNLNAGTLDNARFSAYGDLGAEGYLGSAAGDLALNNGTLQATLNADLLDGYHLGHFNGQVPLSDGSINSNLNADLLDGNHLGNGFGNVPYSNGTLNTSLNADLLDGKHALEVGDPLRRASPPLGNTATTVDNAGDIGSGSSITIGADGLPVISYLDSTNAILKVLHCGDAACTSSTATTVDAMGNVGHNTSITIGADGLPVVSYYDQINADLKVLHCGNAACTTGRTYATVDATGDVGQYSSIAISTDGSPLISYYDITNANLKVLHCGNVACTSIDSIASVDVAGDVGMYSSITIGADGLPLISYHDQTNAALKVLHCGNAACTAGNTPTTVQATGNIGSYNSITIGSDGLPVVSYFNVDTHVRNLNVLHCGNAACTSGNTTTTVDATWGAGGDSSITIGTDGLPVVSYWDASFDDLNVLHCGNAACTSGNTATAVDTTGNVGSYNSITIGADGLPVVSYYDSTNGDLKVLHCSNIFCVPYWRRR